MVMTLHTMNIQFIYIVIGFKQTLSHVFNKLNLYIDSKSDFDYNCQFHQLRCINIINKIFLFLSQFFYTLILE